MIYLEAGQRRLKRWSLVDSDRFPGKHVLEGYDEVTEMYVTSTPVTMFDFAGGLANTESGSQYILLKEDA